MITASSLGRIAICPASAVLPQVANVNDRAERGTVLHEFLENVASVGREEALKRVQDPSKTLSLDRTEEYRTACEIMDLDKLPVNSAQWAAEVAMIYDVRTGKAFEVGRGIGRDYARALGRDPLPSEMGGTADILGLALPSVITGDYKSGRMPVPAASRNWQVRFLTMVACRIYGGKRGSGFLTHLEPDGGAWHDNAQYDEFEIDVIEMEVVAVYERVERSRAAVARGEHPEYVTGEHCRWCPCYMDCHAQTALVRKVADAARADVPTETALGFPARGELTTESAPIAYRQLKALKALVRRAESQLYDLARHTPFSIGDGRMLGEVETPGRPKYDAEKARAVLVARFGRDVADAACTFSTSGAAIERAIAAVVEKGKGAATKREVLEAIAAAGGVSRESKWDVGEYDEVKE